MKKAVVFFSFIIAVFSLLAFNPAYGEVKIHVLINDWDGTERSVIQPMYQNGELPNLASVGEMYNLTDDQECYSNVGGRRKVCTQTSTKPQHAIMMTGCLANVTGVYLNGIFGLIPDGITIYEIIKMSDPSIKVAHISGKSGNFGLPTFGNIVPDVDYFGILNPPEKGASKAIELISQWRNGSFFMMVHFRNPDHIGHQYGFKSSQYADAIRNNDILLGKILQALEAASDENTITIIYIPADHGFGCPVDYNHRCAPNTFVVSNDPAVNHDLMIREIASIVLANFGLTSTCSY